MAIKPNSKGVVTGTKGKDSIKWNNPKSKLWKKNLTVNAGAGNDIINFASSTYKNKLNGGDGKDKIYGGKNNDVITGGKHNDTIYTGAGSNIVKINKGDGNDIIVNQGKKLVIQMGTPHAKDKTTWQKKGNNLIMTYAHYKAKGDKTLVKEIVTIKNYFNSDGTIANNNIYLKNKTTNKLSALFNAKTLKLVTVSGKTYGSYLNDTINGTSSNDTIYGGAGNDVLKGNAGKDYIDAGSGDDNVTGGTGDDIIVASSGKNTVNIAKGDGKDTIKGVGTSTSLTLNLGTGIKNVFAYQDGTDYVIERHYATTGDDVIEQTILQGFDYATSKDKVTLNYNDATKALSTVHLEGFDPATTKIANLDSNGDFSTEEEETSYVVYGDERANHISTNNGNDIIDAGEGNNEISITGGNNRVTSGSGNDEINIGGSGRNVVNAGSGDNQVTVAGHDNEISTGNGTDVISVTGIGDNTITTGNGKKTINVSNEEAGTTTVTTGDGADEITVNSAGNNNISAGAGANEITVTNGSNTITAGDDGNLFTLNSSAEVSENSVTSGSGADTFNVQKGTNTITTGGGADSLNISGGTNEIDMTGTTSGTISITGGTSTITNASYNNSFHLEGGTSNIDIVSVPDSDTTNASATILGGSHTVSTKNGNDNFTISGGTNNSINTGDGADNVSITGGSNRVDLGSGADNITVDSTAGASTIIGGKGTDAITVNSSASSEIWGGNTIAGANGDTDSGTNTINVQVGGSHTIHGGSWANNDHLGDTINAGYNNEGNFSIIGGGQNDYIDASKTKNATIEGSAGNDTIIGGEHNGSYSSIRGGDGNDSIEVHGYGAVYGDAGDDRIIVAGGGSTIDGGSGNDAITNTASTNGKTYYGGSGEDTIYAYGLNNTIYGGIDTSGTDADEYTVTKGQTYNNKIHAGAKSRIYAGTGVEAEETIGDDTIKYYKGDYITAEASSTIYGAAGRDEISIRGAANEVDGGSGNDYIKSYDTMTVTNSSISGGAGDDEINIKGSGNTVAGDAGDDNITVTGGGNNVGGDYGADYIYVDGEVGEKNTIYGGTNSDGNDNAANYIRTTKGDNTIYGGNGDSLTGKGDTITVGSQSGGEYYGNNTIYGGSRNDSINAQDAASASIEGGLGNDTIYGSRNGNSVLKGGGGTDHIYTYGSNSLAEGGDGDDTITSDTVYGDVESHTNITLRGGAGDDTIQITPKNSELLVFKKGDGNDTVELEDIYTTLSGGGDTIRFEDSELSELYAQVDSSNNLTITYNKGASTPDSVQILNFLTAYNNDKKPITTIQYKNGGGYDTISIDDFINTRSIIEVPSTQEYFYGSRFNETIIGGDNEGTDSIYGYGGDDFIDGGAGSDKIWGDGSSPYGNDTLYGGTGHDTLYGGDGNDKLYADALDTLSRETSLSGGEDNTSALYGGEGDDTLYGGSGNDYLYGEEGSDKIYAKYGDNFIYGGSGNDELYSGTGNDRFVFDASPIDGTDTIFSGSGNDTIDIYSSFRDDTRSEATEKNYSKSGNDLVIATYKNDLGEVVSKVIVKDFFPNANVSAKYVKYSGEDDMLLTDMKIYQKADGDTITALNKFNDFLEGSDEADTFNNVGGGTHTDSYNDLVVGGAGDDTINIANTDGDTISYAKIRIANGDGTDTIVNAQNATKVMIQFADFAEHIDSYQSGDNYIIERRHANAGNDGWIVEKTILYGFIYDEETTNQKIEIYNGSNASTPAQLSDFHIADYNGTPELARTFWDDDTDKFVYTSDNTAHYVRGTIYVDSITTGDGDDIIESFEGNDTINAGNGNNRITATGSNIREITTGTGDDTITAQTGRSTIVIAGGNNTVTASESQDTITINGSGTNTVDLGAGADDLIIEGGNNTVTSANTYGVENITIGGEGTNTVTATAGGDENISITGGANTITTGSNNDTIVSGGTTSNTITTAGAENRITVTGKNATVNINNSIGQNQISLNTSGTNVVNTTGTSNTITTQQGDNTITIKSDGYYSDPMANTITVGGSGTNIVTIEGDGNTNTINMNATGTSTITGSEGSDTINVTAGTNTINANAGGDSIDITGGTNTINMGSASGAYVTIETNASTNTINGNDKFNTYYIKTGTNTLNLAAGQNGHDNVSISGGTNTVNGSTGNDCIATVSGGTNNFDLGAGDDAIDIKDASTNTIYGGYGSDEINALYGSNTIYGGKAPTVVGGASDDDASNNIDIGGDSAVVYAGDGVWDTRQIWKIDHYEEEDYYRGDSITASRDLTEGTIYGGAGDDTIYMKNNDVASININGGAGNDYIVGSNTGNSTIHGGDDDDVIRIYTGDENLVYGDAGNDTIEVYNNTMFGGQKAATIYGGTGDDEISLNGTFKETLVFNAGDGNDVILNTWDKTAQDTLIFNGMAYEDLIVNYDDYNEYSLTITYNGGVDSVRLNYLPSDSNFGINSSIATIIATGDPSYDPEEPAGITLTELLNTRSIYTLSPQDTQTGASFGGLMYDEHITGTDLDDDIWGRSGDDTIYGGAGDDRLYGDGGSDSITGNDYIDGGAGDDEIDGNAGNDTLLGGADNDDIGDSEGYNTIYGGTGNDIINAAIDDTTTGHNTIGFATGDGTDEINDYGGENHATLKFDNVNSYDDLHISYETENGSYYYLVIQYGENATDKVRLYDYKFDEDHDVGVKINGQDEIALNTLLVNKHIIVPENTNSNGPIEGTANNDYIYATAYQPTITGGLGNDTIESVGDDYETEEGTVLNNPTLVDYKFNKAGDGHDVILNARHRIDSSDIIFTGFTHEQLHDYDYRDAFFEGLVCTKTNDGDLVITYGTDSSITIKGFYANPMIKRAFDKIRVAHEEADEEDLYEIYDLEDIHNLQIQKQMANDTPFYGDNQAPEYITGTAGNDTLTVGASKGINIFTPSAGQDTVIFEDRYTDETIEGGVISGTNKIADGSLHKTYINMGTADSPDTLWFKNIDSIDNLSLGNNKDALQISYYNTGELGITEYQVELRNFLSTDTPGFTKIKLGVGDNEGAATVTTIQDIAVAKNFQYVVDNRETKAANLTTSILKDYVLMSDNVTETVHTYGGNDKIDDESQYYNQDPGADTIYAGDGNDTISFGNAYGNDAAEFYGEGGDDTIYANFGKIYGGGGSDYISVQDATSYYSETGEYRSVTIYGGTETGEGESTEDSDTINTSLSHGNNVINGGIGGDSIQAGYGNDTIYGGDGDDIIKGAEGNDSIMGGMGADSIFGDDGDDFIDGGAGNDTIYGGYNGDDTINGGAGADSILTYTYTQSDLALFEQYNKVSDGHSAEIHGGIGNDVIMISTSHNEIWGDMGDDTITTAKDAKTRYHFRANNGNDVIRSSNKGNNGDDTIVFDDIAFDGTNVKAEMDYANNRLIIRYDYYNDEWNSSITLENYICANGSGGYYDQDDKHPSGLNRGRRSSIQYLVDMNGNKINLKSLVKTTKQTGVTDNTHYTFFSDDITYSSAAGVKLGGEGDDTLTGTSGNDSIFGDDSNQNDIVGHDYIDGKAGKNYLKGQEGNDTLVGGYDNNTDSLYGGSGDNTFQLVSGASSDTIVAAEIYSDSAGDVLFFPNVTAAGNFFKFAKSSNDLEIRYYGNAKWNKAVIKDYFLNPHNYKVQYVDSNQVTRETTLHALFRGTDFDFDGVSLVTGSSETASTNAAKIGSNSADTISPYGNNNTLIGGAGNDSITSSNGTNSVTHGGDGNDTIVSAVGKAFGGNGNDRITISGTLNTTTVYGGAGADYIDGSGVADLIFAGEKPHGDDSISYSQRVFVEGYLDTPDAMGGTNSNSSVSGRGGNDTICAFGENIYFIDGGAGNDEYHTLLTNNIYINDGRVEDNDTLHLHSIGSEEKAYIVMGVNSGGSISDLYVVNEENYNNWLDNNGSFTSGHGGIHLAGTNPTGSVDTIISSENLTTTTAKLDQFKEQIVAWLDGKTSSVATALADETYRDDMIAMFNTFNSTDTLNGGWS